MVNDTRDKVVLVTGGTRGIGLATGLAFGAQGARVTLTCRWGAEDEDELRALFARAEAPEPRIVQADVVDDEDTAALIEELGDCGGVDILVSNVGFAQLVRNLEQYDRRGLLRSIEYSAWPLASYPRALHAAYGRYPRHVVGLSSLGAEHYHLNYDFAGAAKAVLETLCRYLAHRLGPHGCRVNVVRASYVDTESLEATMGPDFVAFMKRFGASGQFVEPEEVADVVLMLCSGLLDGMAGQVLTVDRGATFSDCLMRLYAERQELGLPSQQPKPDHRSPQ